MKNLGLLVAFLGLMWAPSARAALDFHEQNGKRAAMANQLPKGVEKKDDDNNGMYSFEDLIGQTPEEVLGADPFEAEDLQQDIADFPLNPRDVSDDPQVFASPGAEDEANTYDMHKFEGDIVNVKLPDLVDLYDQANANPLARNAIRRESALWPNAKVPYLISSHFNSHQRSIILAAMEKYKELTCVRFIPRTNQRDYIHIYKGQGCSSSVGRVGGAQKVSLGNGCVWIGIVQHELMHAIGFWHEQSRADRDSYVNINWNNINQAMKYNFMKYSLTQISHLGTNYDACSVMHYGKYAFSANGRPSITPKGNIPCELGQRNGLSENDIRKINILYKCPDALEKENKEETVTIKPDLTCQDQDTYCATWAKNGECQNNTVWMSEHCPVACNGCENPCADHDVSCVDWEKEDQCEKNPDYMNVYCAASCKACPEDEDEGNSGNEVCKNTYFNQDHCDGWAHVGYCNSKVQGKDYREFMQKQCRKSCNLC